MADETTTPRRRRRMARLAIYERGGQHVVLDLAGTTAEPEVYRSPDMLVCAGFIAGAVWAGRATPTNPAPELDPAGQQELGSVEGDK